ncbi:unnamed protein product [Urochloa humidicola]
MEPAVEKKEAEQEEQQLPQARKDDAPAAAAAEEDEADSEETERRNRDLKAGLHPLRRKLVLWYTRRTPGARSQAYEDNIKKIIDFSTVESFWVCYCHLARPSSLPSPTDLHLFKDGIRPLWEDPANQNGGKWIIRFKKAVSGRFWEDLVLVLVGDQLEYSDDVCGVVLSVRFNEDILSCDDIKGFYQEAP